MVQRHPAVRLKAIKRLQPRPATAGLTTRSINVSAGLARAHTTYKRVKTLSSLDTLILCLHPEDVGAPMTEHFGMQLATDLISLSASVSNRQPCESNTFIVWLTEIKSTLAEVFKEDDVLRYSSASRRL